MPILINESTSTRNTYIDNPSFEVLCNYSLSDHPLSHIEKALAYANNKAKTNIEIGLKAYDRLGRPLPNHFCLLTPINRTSIDLSFFWDIYHSERGK